MEVRVLYVALTLALVIFAAMTSIAGADEAQSPEDYFKSVLSRMASLPQPPLISYDVVARASGARFYVTRDPQTGEAQFGFSIGSALGETHDWWPVIVRTKDNATSVQLDDAYAVTRFPALNATWSGIDSWMRIGMQNVAAPPAPVSGAQPSGTLALPVIAVVRSLDPSIYRVRDGGASNCDDGAAAHLFHLTARTDRFRHPATDVTVDTTTNTVCTIRFEMPHNDLVDRDGYVELHLGSVDSYYVVKRGEISFTAGPRLGRQHVRLFLDYARMAFPQTFPQGAFEAANETHK